MKVVILQSNYIPWKGYFDLIHDADTFVWYDEVQYTKNDWRNRNQIYSKNGLFWLTIPIARSSVKKKISEVLLPESFWREKHLSSIRACYGQAKYFDQVYNLANDFLLNHEVNTLSQLNRQIIQSVCTHLGIKTKFIDSRDLDVQGDRVTRLLDILTKLKATTYISGPAAKEYLAGHEQGFDSRNIKLVFKNYSGYPAYQQMKEPFLQGVSILDLFANLHIDEMPFFIWGWRGK